MCIVEDTANNLYRVIDWDISPVAWMAIPVRRVPQGFEDRAPATPRLIRRAGCHIVAEPA